MVTDKARSMIFLTVAHAGFAFKLVLLFFFCPANKTFQVSSQTSRKMKKETRKQKLKYGLHVVLTFFGSIAAATITLYSEFILLTTLSSANMWLLLPMILSAIFHFYVFLLYLKYYRACQEFQHELTEEDIGAEDVLADFQKLKKRFGPFLLITLTADMALLVDLLLMLTFDRYFMASNISLGFFLTGLALSSLAVLCRNAEIAEQTHKSLKKYSYDAR